MKIFFSMKYNRKSILNNDFCKIVEYTQAMPGTNAAIETVFSITNVLWTNNEKIAFLYPTPTQL